ncbi:MAG TPA: hypothetical protein P5072_11960, partial [Parvularculaceae bacterium]|nr:hypothetical protein [Parvularculaceae bacterium]
MIKSGERVVVVAGAGCSAEFGLPTGIGLMRRLHSEALQESPTSGLSFADIFRRPFLEVFPSAYENKFNGRDVLEFLREAKNLYADSIDLFAFNHPSKAEVCKAYSTLGIMRGLYSETSVQDRFGDTSNYFELAYKWRKPLVSAGNSSRPNWLASLARK